MASLISSAVWVKRGIAKQHPQKYNLDQNELERISRLAGNRLTLLKNEHKPEEEEEEEEIVDVEEMIAGEEDEEWTDQDSAPEQDKMELDEKEDEMALYNLHDYDKEESKGISMGAFSNIKGLQYYQNPADDPYVTTNARKCV